MRHHLLRLLFAVIAVAGLAGAAPAQAAPPGPQCGAVLPCDGPVEKIRRICQQAYCEVP